MLSPGPCLFTRMYLVSGSELVGSRMYLAICEGQGVWLVHEIRFEFGIIRENLLE